MIGWTRVPLVRLASALVVGAVAGLAPVACGTAGSAGEVVVTGVFVGTDADTFQRVLAPFEAETGITVYYNGSRALDQILQSDVDKDATPDIAVVASPTELLDYYRQHQLVDLDGVLPRQNDYSSQWLDLVRQGSDQFGIVLRGDLKGIVFYDPAALPPALGHIPPTWDELNSLPGTPWCLGLGASSSSGFPGTDWIEEIMLKMWGPSIYREWAEGQLPWSSPQVREAFTTWAGILAKVRGGPAAALLTNFDDTGKAMFAARPGCYLDSEGSYMTQTYTAAGVHAGKDFRYFPLPSIDPPGGADYDGDYEVAGNFAGMFHDTPAARALMTYLSSEQAQELWVRSGSFSADRQVPPATYPDDVHRAIARVLTTGPSLSFDASDLMSDALGAAFEQAVLKFAANPTGDELTTLLRQLDEAAATGTG